MINTMYLKMQLLQAFVYFDTGFININLLKQNTCYQGYSSKNFVHIHPMQDQKEARNSQTDFTHDIEALLDIITDIASFLTGKDS